MGGVSKKGMTTHSATNSHGDDEGGMGRGREVRLGNTLTAAAAGPPVGTPSSASPPPAAAGHSSTRRRGHRR